jgi:hypothetical protein
MRRLLSFFFLLTIKSVSLVFYRFKIGWPAEKPIDWKKAKLIVFLNHTSLFEFVFLSIVPVSFLWQLSQRLAAPGADKTLDRPIVGLIYKIMSPGMTAITRKRDESWDQFMDSITEDSIIIIAPEGRMKRRTGLDLEGNKMTVRPGVLDVLHRLNKNNMLLAYSGGLHHVQAPGEGFPKLFRTIKMNVEELDIAEYKAGFAAEEGSREWRKLVLADLQFRLETKVPDNSTC